MNQIINYIQLINEWINNYYSTNQEIRGEACLVGCDVSSSLAAESG
jgi:hypothetical protein